MFRRVSWNDWAGLFTPILYLTSMWHTPTHIEEDHESDDSQEHEGYNAAITSTDIDCCIHVHIPVGNYPHHPRGYRHQRVYPIIRGESHCPHCFCTPCVIEMPPDFLQGSASPHPANDEKRYRLYRLFWRTLNDLGVWRDDEYLARKERRTVIHDRREIFPECIIAVSTVYTCIVVHKQYLSLIKGDQEISKPWWLLCRLQVNIWGREWPIGISIYVPSSTSMYQNTSNILLNHPLLPHYQMTTLHHPGFLAPLPLLCLPAHCVCTCICKYHLVKFCMDNLHEVWFVLLFVFVPYFHYKSELLFSPSSS